MNCLYCPKPLDGSDEHIILSALGGRKSSTQILCAGCNNDFGSTIDAELLRTLQYFTLIVDPPSRRRENAQKLRVTDDKGDVYEMRAGGKLKVPMRRVEPSKWIADASDAERLRHHAQRAADATRHRTGETVEVTSLTGEIKPGPFVLPGQFDNVSTTREMLKWVLNLLGIYVLTTDALRDPHILETERSFVSNGNPLPLAGYLEQSVIPGLYDGLLHYALAIQTPNGSVYWEASAYGGMVATSGHTAPIPVRFEPLLYVVDPITGNHAMSDLTMSGSLRDDECHWTPQPSPIVHERVKSAGVRLMQLMNGRIGIEKLIDECMSEHLSRGVVITQEHINAVSRCVAEKYMELTRHIDELSRVDASGIGENSKTN